MSYYVICRTHEEYTHFLRRNMVDTRDCVYVDSVWRLKGLDKPRGIFTGQWYKRGDISEIFNHLQVSRANPDQLKLAMDYYYSEPA